MAVDTAAKRYSMIGLGAPVPSLLPIPDGTIAQADRAHLAWLYSGITLATPAVVYSQSYTGDVAIRLTALGDVAIRRTALGSVEI